MRRVPLAIVPRTGEEVRLSSQPVPTEGHGEVIEAEARSVAPLLHTHITGRHGVFLLEQGEDGASELVDTRAPRGIVCTCGQADCDHVAILRACGFLAVAA